MNTSTSTPARASVTHPGAIERAIGLLERVPYALLAIPLRLAVATVFWNSGTTKLANWDATLQLFEDDYKVPLLPPDVGLIVTAAQEAIVLREAPLHRMAGARRRALMHRFATLAACRLENMVDPVDRFALSCA